MYLRLGEGLAVFIYVAIKVILRTSRTIVLQDLFVHEARIGSMLQHQNVVRSRPTARQPVLPGHGA